ncbi:MCE family protein [Mycobacterium sp. MYCO198283]|uniref:MCE family protein n=1 Tax=Mycobacterium sp. MYCO198283 TaxID=2883505 RepID=UPI001E46C9EE|nr:MCE family protein [Mycobacterium sp. MYCO198283]MCG5434173.1 MCE family protein [Mycobacterium sp. MYCO198283]
MSRTRLVAITAVALVVLLAAGAVFVVRQHFFGPKTITAYFTTTTAIYPGDEVRVSGVKVGKVESIEPVGTESKMVLKVDHDVPVPADARAVIVSQNLVAARYVQLAPAYRSSGPTMPDGAVITSDRTAVPVEWDEVKDQLMRLATDLGPKSGVDGTSVSRFIDSAADAMDGNGDKLRSTLAQLSGAARILAEGSGDIVNVIKNLQVFVSALRGSGQQIMQFNDRLATLTSVVNGSRDDLDAALTDLSVALGEVQRFVAGSRDATVEQVRGLSQVTQTLADNKISVENLLHVAPNAFANAYNIYNPDTGDPVGAFVLNTFENPVQFICGAIGAIENATGPETAKLCADYLGPAARFLSLNQLPIPINPILAKQASPDNLIYSEDRLREGNPKPPPDIPYIPPDFSAYSGIPGFPIPPSSPPPGGPAVIPADQADFGPPLGTPLPAEVGGAAPAEGTPTP